MPDKRSPLHKHALRLGDLHLGKIVAIVDHDMPEGQLGKCVLFRVTKIDGRRPIMVGGIEIGCLPDDRPIPRELRAIDLGLTPDHNGAFSPHRYVLRRRRAAGMLRVQNESFHSTPDTMFG